MTKGGTARRSEWQKRGSFRVSGFFFFVNPDDWFLSFRHSGRAKRDPESRNHADP